MKFLIKKWIAALLKTNPRLFDRVKSLSRFFSKNEIYRLLDEYNSTKSNPFVIQIGANDGMSNDPLREFFVKYDNWRGQLLEPLPNFFTQLKRNYRHISEDRLSLLQSGISDKKGVLHIYQIKDEFIHEFPRYALQIASLDKQHLIRHFPSLENENDKIEEIEIKVTTITDLIKDLGPVKVDIVCMDIEGMEYRVLKSFPFNFFKPDILIFEILHLNSPHRKEIYNLMKLNGYQLYEFYFDAIALQPEVCPSWQKKFNNCLV